MKFAKGAIDSLVLENSSHDDSSSSSDDGSTWSPDDSSSSDDDGSSTGPHVPSSNPSSAGRRIVIQGDSNTSTSKSPCGVVATLSPPHLPQVTLLQDNPSKKLSSLSTVGKEGKERANPKPRISKNDDSTSKEKTEVSVFPEVAPNNPVAGCPISTEEPDTGAMEEAGLKRKNKKSKRIMAGTLLKVAGKVAGMMTTRKKTEKGSKKEQKGGKKPDHRIQKAVQAIKQDPGLILRAALIKVGFNYPPDATDKTVDNENKTLETRKNQLQHQLKKQGVEYTRELPGGKPGPVDNRMQKAIQAVKQDPSLTLRAALIKVGFNYPPDATDKTVDNENKTLETRKRLLQRHLNKQGVEYTRELPGRKRAGPVDNGIQKAIQAVKQDPSLTLREALIKVGFNYPPDATDFTVDNENTTLKIRKNLLQRHLNNQGVEYTRELPMQNTVEDEEPEEQYQSFKVFTDRVNMEIPHCGIEVEVPKSVASDEKLDYYIQEITSNNEKGFSMAMLLPPPVFRAMQEKGDIGKLPHNAHYMMQTTGRDHKQCFRFATNDGFEAIPKREDVGYHALDNEGNGYKVVNSFGGGKKIIHPVVYFIHKKGFAISCTRKWKRSEYAQAHVQEGTADIIGYYRKSFKVHRTEPLYLCREYKVQASGVNKLTLRRRFTGVHYLMDGSSCNAALGAAVLVTFVGPREPDHILQHDGDSHINSLALVRWIRFEENNLKENLDPEAANKRPYYISKYEINEDYLPWDTWYPHPKLPVKVYEDGDHVYDYERGCFLTIHHYQWYLVDWSETRVYVRGRSGDYSFPRLAVECFKRRELAKDETVEHIDCDRNNNRKSNLVIRHMLFQANAKKAHKFGKDSGDVPGVCWVEKKKYYKAQVRVYTPDAPAASTYHIRYFSVKDYDTKERAKEAAVAFKNKHTLHTGMAWTDNVKVKSEPMSQESQESQESTSLKPPPRPSTTQVANNDHLSTDGSQQRPEGVTKFAAV